jgi:membrane protease YdiL (CAAX protease family)
MKSHPFNSVLKRKSPLTFFLLVLVMSVFLWGVGPVAEQFLAKDMLIDLPLSSLMAFCPVIAAVILVQRESGWNGVNKLLRRSFDLRRIKGKTWYVPILFLMPTIMVLQYGLMNPVRAPIPAPQFPLLMAPVFFAIFFIAAVGEEVGWQGYAVETLLDRWNALTASVVLGIV